MPMRIISQGRHAYILAGFLQKRGKWSWQWSERYFVLTSTALHYFKRDRMELYGKERGAFLLEDMSIVFYSDKLSFDIRSESSGVTRTLKAPNEREYMTWCRAFQEALARKDSNTAAPIGISLDSLHTIAAQHGVHGGPHAAAEYSQSVESWASSSQQRPSLQGQPNLQLHPLSASATPNQHRLQNHAHSMRSLTSHPSGANGGAVSVASRAGSNSRLPSGAVAGESTAAHRAKSPATAANLSVNTLSTSGAFSRAAAPSASPDIGYLSGASSPSPMPSDRKFDAPGSAAMTHDASCSTSTLSKHRSIAGSDSYQPDVLRRYSMQDPSPMYPPIGLPAHRPSVRDPIGMVTVDGAVPVAAGSDATVSSVASPRVIVGSGIEWNSPLTLPTFTAGSGAYMSVTLADGSTAVVMRDSMSKELDAGLKEGTKIVPIEPSPLADDDEPTRQLLLSWRILEEVCCEVPIKAKQQYIRLIGVPIVFLVLMLAWLAELRGLPTGCAMLVAIGGVAFAVQSILFHWRALARIRTSRQQWEVTFVSVLENASSSSSQTLSVPQRKRKGILRRRANDLPADLVAMHASEVNEHALEPLMAHGRGAFEMSEYSDSGASTRESSQVGMSRRHRRRGRTNNASGETDPQSSAGEEDTQTPMPLDSPLAVSVQPATSASATLDRVGSHQSDGPSAPTSAISSESEFQMVRAGSESASRTSAPRSTHLRRHQSARSEADSEHPDDFETDVESHGALSDDIDAEEETAQIDAAIAESLNGYDDTPVALTPAHMPPLVAAPWGAWSEDDTSMLKVRGATFKDDKVKVPVGVPIFKLVHVDMFYTAQTNDNLVHVTSRPGNWGYQYLARREQRWSEMRSAAGVVGVSDMPHAHDPASPLFVLNFLFPGPSGKNMNLVLYFLRRIRPGEELKRRKEGGGTASNAASRRGSKNQGHVATMLAAMSSRPSSPGASPRCGPFSPAASPAPGALAATVDISRVCAFDGLLRRFLDGPPTAQAELDEFRDCRLKIIPRIAVGPWVVRKGVGCVPAILGKKVKQRYFRSVEKNYMEVVADVSSSMVAGRILALVKGAATSLTIDLSFTLQGESMDELPESLLGGVRIYQCNMDKLLEIQDHERWLTDVWLKQEREAGRW